MSHGDCRDYDGTVGHRWRDRRRGRRLGSRADDRGHRRGLLDRGRFRLGLVWTARLRDETDPGRQLMLNLLLALAVLLALVGVGLMSAPLV